MKILLLKDLKNAEILYEVCVFKDKTQNLIVSTANLEYSSLRKRTSDLKLEYYDVFNIKNKEFEDIFVKCTSVFDSENESKLHEILRKEIIKIKPEFLL